MKEGFWNICRKGFKTILDQPVLVRPTLQKPPLFDRSGYSSYALHGLALESQLPLPSVVSPTNRAESDVIVETKLAPPSLNMSVEDGARYRAGPGNIVIWMDQVARYSVHNGNKIVVQPFGGSSKTDVTELLLSSPIAALLLQRGSLVFHASAIAAHNGAVLILGRSAAGKSSLAVWLAQHGARFMSDDICAVDFDRNEQPFVNPGPARVRLLPSAAKRIAAGRILKDTKSDVLCKVSIDLADCYHHEKLPIRKVYLLRVGPVDSHKLMPILAVKRRSDVFMFHTHGMPLLRPIGLHDSYLRRVELLAANIQLTEYVRTKGADTISELGKLILDDILE